MASHLLVAGAGTAIVLAAAGAGLGAARAVATGDAGDVPRLIGATLASAPAVWVLAAVAVALFGLVPRAALAGWGALAAVWIVVFFSSFSPVGVSHATRGVRPSSPKSSITGPS